VRQEITSEERDDLTQMDITPETLANRFENFPMYLDFVTFYVSPVIGLRHFNNEKSSKLYSSYATVSDEAFAVLTLENNWNRWMAMAVANHWTDSPIRTKYTVTRDKAVSGQQGSTKKKRKSDTSSAQIHASDPQEQENGPQARRYRGWSAHGINRYNQLFDQIEKERNTQRGKCFEKDLLDYYQTKAATESKQRRTIKEPAASLPMPRHQLWSTNTTVATRTAESIHTNRQGKDDDGSDEDDSDESDPDDES
jgi:hypothetical protein